MEEKGKKEERGNTMRVNNTHLQNLLTPRKGGLKGRLNTGLT